MGWNEAGRQGIPPMSKTEQSDEFGKIWRASYILWCDFKAFANNNCKIRNPRL
jgi:hypothetical protein